jgi:hypothetical protein
MTLQPIGLTLCEMLRQDFSLLPPETRLYIHAIVSTNDSRGLETIATALANSTVQPLLSPKPE